MEDIQCIFCNKYSNQIAIEENGYQGRKCPSCGLIYISPRPSLTEIENLYSYDEAHVSAESHILGAFRKRLHAKHNLRIIKKFIKKGSMLEIGAGAGYFLDESRKEGFEVYGIELNNIQAHFIRSKMRIPCEESPLNDFLYDGKKFDIIYHCDIISHFYDPIEAFKRINERLVNNGILVFETGNLGDVKEKYYKNFTEFQYPDHLFFFSENNLNELLRQTGFDLIKIYRYSILLQLSIDKNLEKAKDFIESEGNTENSSKISITESYNTSNPTFNRFDFKQLIKNIFSYLSYLIRYKIGNIMPKKERPQTVILIARKRKRYIS